MPKIRLAGQNGVMACAVTDVPAFPGEAFTLGYPEAIGDAAAPYWYGSIKPRWESGDDGTWVSSGEQPGQLAYTMKLIPGDDFVTTSFTLTNLSDRTWTQGMAFNCLQCAAAQSVRDHDCERHWVRVNGQLKRLVELPRVYGPRPAIQLYSVEDAPEGKDIPFVANFRATPEVVAEPWMAIVARDGKRLVATVSKPGLFLFQNREYSCIHSGAGFGKIGPGQTAAAVNRVYFVRCALAEWHARMVREVANGRAFLPSGQHQRGQVQF